ncbi:MAG: hypothetical protein MZV70_54780 [Desulfobacterales bacterium]|nr:hypothetical protein [Desulfobacterales bacterium]
MELADASLNSDVEIVEALSIEARMQRKVHGVILMVDLHTGREGLPPERSRLPAASCSRFRVFSFRGSEPISTWRASSELHLHGLQALVRLAKQVETDLGKPLAMLSGGLRTSFVPSRWKATPTPGINHLRIGTAILLGFASSLNPITIDGFERDTFVLQAEVIEVKAGQTGEAILALGKIDTDPQFLFPVNPGVTVQRCVQRPPHGRMDPLARVGRLGLLPSRLPGALPADDLAVCADGVCEAKL